jgi:hypothetical protein
MALGMTNLAIHGAYTSRGIHASGHTALRRAPMRWFKSHELMAFRPFSIYCLVAGAAALLILLV